MNGKSNLSKNIFADLSSFAVFTSVACILLILRVLFTSISKVMLVCPQCNKPTRVGYKIDGDTKARICKKCGKPVDTKKEEKKEVKKKATKKKATTKKTTVKKKPITKKTTVKKKVATKKKVTKKKTTTNKSKSKKTEK